MSRFTPQVFSASWDSVVFDVPGRPNLQRVPILEPERGTREQVGPLLDQSVDVGPSSGHWPLQIDPSVIPDRCGSVPARRAQAPQRETSTQRTA